MELRQVGVASVRAEAEWLLAGVLDVNRTTLYLWEDPLTASQAEAVERLLARRLRGEPLPYVVGWTEFCGLRLRVSPAVLIPRPETEGLAQQAVAYMKRRTTCGKGTLQVLDIGTGSGAIAVALAKAVPACVVTALELSWDALQVARANAGAHHVADRIRFIQTDWTRGMSGRYDLIVSNPPYVPADDVDNAWEPRMSLAGGTDGMAFHRRLLADAPALLVPRAALGMECGEAQAASLQAAAEGLPWVARTAMYHDLAQRPRGVWIESRMAWTS